MTDLEAGIPQEIEQELDQALAPRRLLVGQEEQEIDVGARRQRAAPIAADRNHRDALRRRRVVRLVDSAPHCEERADQPVLGIAQGPRAGRPLAVGDEPRLRLAPGRSRKVADERHQRPPLRRRVAAGARHRRLAALDERRLVRHGNMRRLVHRCSIAGLCRSAQGVPGFRSIYGASIWGNKMTTIGPGSYVPGSSAASGQAPQAMLSDEQKALRIVGPMTEQDRTQFLEFFAISGISADNEPAVLDFYRNYRHHLTPGETISEA